MTEPTPIALSASADVPTPGPAAARVKVEVRDLSVWYGPTQALHGVSIDVPERSVLALDRRLVARARARCSAP